METKKSAWLSAFRLRTLPLAFASIFLGTALAVFNGYFNSWVFLLALVTAFALQILSNIANDYGDGLKGTDNSHRIGPARALQSGLLNKHELIDGMVVFAVVAFLSGCLLIFLASGLKLVVILSFLIIGCLAIYAAVKYTVGNNAYGYSGFGDLFVFVFFGIVAVLGTNFLHQHSINASSVLPAITFGLLSVGVLNVNNMRDILNDKASGKITIPVRLGIKKSRLYHTIIISVAMLCLVIFTITNYLFWMQWLFVLALPAFGFHLYKIFTIKTYNEFDPLLKQLAILCTICVVLFGIGLIVAVV
mgnify:CR=1 FL=1